MISFVDIGEYLLLNGFFRFLTLAILFPTGMGLVGVGSRIGIVVALTTLNWQSEMLQVRISSCGLVLAECVFGMILSVPLLVVCYGLRMWGDLFESLRGHQIGLIIDPLSASGEEQPLAIFLAQAFLYLVLAEITAPLLLQSAFISLVDLPPARLSSEILAENIEQLFAQISSILATLFRTLIPFALIVVISEMALSLVGKLCPGLSLSHEGYLLRMVVLLSLLGFQATDLFRTFLAPIIPSFVL